jgi:hypothetical protein
MVEGRLKIREELRNSVKKKERNEEQRREVFMGCRCHRRR